LTEETKRAVVEKEEVLLLLIIGFSLCNNTTGLLARLGQPRRVREKVGR
jgi:hypothetical protein